MKINNSLILTAVRDEGPYLLEWIAYHRAIGFSNFLVYTNDCRDGSDLLLDRLQHNGVLVHERNKVLKRGPQKSAFKAAMKHPAYLNAEWVLANDVDEFLTINVGEGQLADLLELYPDADAIPVCWRMFSHDGQEGFINGFTIEVLTDAESAEPEPEAVGRFVKTLFRPRAEVERVGTHAPVYTDEFEARAVFGAPWCSGGKTDDPRRPQTDYGYHVAQMNHYAVRSVDSFLLKRDRGDANYMANRLEAEYWERWCRGGTVDTSVTRMIPFMKKELATLLEDPVVKHLHDAAVEFHERRIEELLKTEEYQEVKRQVLALCGTELSKAVAKPAVDPVAKPAENVAASELALKAPGRHKNRLRMLEQLPKQGRGAEIGVWNGGFSEYILRVTQPEELVLIDPWDLIAEQSEEEQTHKKHADSEFMGEMYGNVTSLYEHLENVRIIKGFSADVLATFDDDYFDWVYVDVEPPVRLREEGHRARVPEGPPGRDHRGG